LSKRASDGSAAAKPALSQLCRHSNGMVTQVLTVFPLTAPLVLPARSALVGVPLWEHALAIVLVLATIYALIRLAGRLYAHGLLHTGPRLSAWAAWTATRQRRATT